MAPVQQEQPKLQEEMKIDSKPEESSLLVKRPLLLPVRRTSDHQLIYTEANIYQVAFLHKTIVGKFRLELEDTATRKLDEKRQKDKQNAKKVAQIERKEALSKQREEEKQERIAQ